VERRSDPQDRRVNKVHLTPKGNAVLEKMQKIGMEMNAKVMSGISLPRQHQLADMLHTMKANLVAMDVVPGSKRASRGRRGRDTSPYAAYGNQAADAFD